MSKLYLQIAVPKPIRRLFIYSLPADWPGPAPKPGARVKIPFGRQTLIGVLVSTHSDKPDFAVKDIAQVIDEAPLLDDHCLKLLAWAAQYYCHPVGDVIATALPSRLRQGKPAVRQPGQVWQSLAHDDIQKCLARSPKQRAVYEFIDTHSPCRADQLDAAFENWRHSLRALLDKSLIEVAPTTVTTHDQTESPHTLNPSQAASLSCLKDRAHEYGCHLLFGITGSGKTEVYLQLAEYILQQGKQILIMVPEIGLTPQLARHFERRFQQPLAIMHSGLSDGERQNAWLAAQSGKARMIIGTRSAVFVPMQNPGLIILDEEHDASFKQMDGFRYSARDVAIKRASMLDIPVLLGSATPSIESLQNALQKRFSLLKLEQRATRANTPDIFHISMKNQSLSAGLTKLARQAIDAELQAGGQVLVFLNRRGYAPALVCEQCGWIEECHHCDIRMTWHKRKRHLSCHVCNHEQAVPAQCPDCGHTQFYPLGQGTERLEEFLQQQFPQAGVIRIDRDTTRRKHAFENMIRDIRSGRHRILIGTQMLAKGHHFPQVGTVIILDADNGLYGLDFRSQEHMAQLITQVAGRAGRESRHGKVYIQTWHPEHPFFKSLHSQSYGDFAQELLVERQSTQMPPFSYLALLRAEASHRPPLETFMTFAQQLSTSRDPSIECLGPAMAPLERKAGHYRMQLLFKSPQRQLLHRQLHALIGQLDDSALGKKVRWSVDIDPYDLY